MTVRPSGTEPKIKIYVSLRAENEAMAAKKYERVIGDVLKQK